MSRKYFGTDGVRGRANEGSMAPDIVMKIGMAAGQLYRRGGHVASRSLTLARCVFAPLYICVSSIVLILGACESPREFGIALALVVLFFLARVSMRRFGRAPSAALPESIQP